MSVYKPGDIVEFVNYEHMSEFGLIISVQVSDTISALVVSGFQSNKPQWISTDQVKVTGETLKIVCRSEILRRRNVHTAENRIRKRKKHNAFAPLNAKINGGIVRGLRKANICIRNVKITLMEIGDEQRKVYAGGVDGAYRNYGADLYIHRQGRRLCGWRNTRYL